MTFSRSRFVGVMFAFVIAGLITCLSVFAADPQKLRLRCGDVYVSFWNPTARYFPGHVVFFNDGDYGPYRGSSIGLIGAPELKLRSFSSCGLHYRSIRFGKRTTFTVSVNVLYIGLSIVLIEYLRGALVTKVNAARSNKLLDRRT